MKFAPLIALTALVCAGCAHIWTPANVMPSAEVAVKRIQQSSPFVSLLPKAFMTIEGIAGQYSYPGSTLVSRGGVCLSGWGLCLAKDGTYCYSQWSDVASASTNEIGRWDIVDGFVELTREWIRVDETDFPDDHRYLPMSMKGVRGVLLMGDKYDYSYYLDHVGEDQSNSGTMVLIRTLEKL